MMPELQQEWDTGCEWILFCVSYRIKSSLLLEGVLWEPDSLGCFTSIALAKIKGFTPFSSPVPLSHAESSSGWAFWGTNWRIERSPGRPYDRWGLLGVETHTQAGCPQATGSVGSIRRMWRCSGYVCPFAKLVSCAPELNSCLPVLRPAAQPVSSSTWAPVFLMPWKACL